MTLQRDRGPNPASPGFQVLLVAVRGVSSGAVRVGLPALVHWLRQFFTGE